MQISQEAISPWGSSSANCVVTPPEMLRPVIPLDTSETACLPDLLIMAVMMMASMTTRCQGWLHYHHHDHNHDLQPIVYLLVQLLDHIPPSCLSPHQTHHLDLSATITFKLDQWVSSLAKVTPINSSVDILILACQSHFSKVLEKLSQLASDLQHQFFRAWL